MIGAGFEGSVRGLRLALPAVGEGRGYGRNEDSVGKSNGPSRGRSFLLTFVKRHPSFH
jgi:hypothetical protein